jgi:hypothetical protein
MAEPELHRLHEILELKSHDPITPLDPPQPLPERRHTIKGDGLDPRQASGSIENLSRQAPSGQTTGAAENTRVIYQSAARHCAVLGRVPLFAELIGIPNAREKSN